MEWCSGRTESGAVELAMDTCWAEFAEMLALARLIGRHPEEKSEWIWISPLVQRAGCLRRRLEDIDHLGSWLAIDVDKGDLSLNDIRVRMGCYAQWLAYTTTQSTVEHPRWRVIVSLSRRYSVAEHGRLWRWFSGKFPSDQQTSDASRISYMPATWQEADNQWYCQQGRPADVDSILAMIPQHKETAPTVVHDGLLRPAPVGTMIVTPQMIERAQAASPGGRMIRLLGQCAKRYRMEGWILDPSELAHAAQVASNQFAPDVPRKGLLREATRAINWAANSFSPLSEIEKMRRRVLWQDNHRKY